MIISWHPSIELSGQVFFITDQGCQKNLKKFLLHIQIEKLSNLQYSIFNWFYKWRHSLLFFNRSNIKYATFWVLLPKSYIHTSRCAAHYGQLSRWSLFIHMINLGCFQQVLLIHGCKRFQVGSVNLLFRTCCWHVKPD